MVIRHFRRTFVVTSALALLSVEGAHAETFPAVPNSQLSPPPAASAALRPQSKPRLASPGIPFAGLSVQVQDGVSLLYSNQGGRSFGTLNPLDTPTVQAVFHLKNETDHPVTLERFQPSCHCTAAAVEGAVTEVMPTVAPGKQVAIRVTVDLARHPAGNLEKFVSVYVQGQAQPAAVLAMEAVLTPLVALSPPLLDFGTISAGQAKTLPLTVTLDPRLAVGNAFPALRSSNGSLRVVTQPIIVIAPVPGTRPKTLTCTYMVTLSADAPAGPLNGTLSFAPAGKAGSVTAQAFADGSVLLLGQVQGAVNALPQSLAFGTVKQGEEATRQIALMGNKADDVKTLSTASPSPYVSAHLLPLSPMFGVGNQLVTNARTLVVTLSPQAPAGTMQTQLRVSLASGRHLVIPITAYVSAPISY